MTGEPALRREVVQQLSSPSEWTRQGWYIFTLPANPCEPEGLRLFGGAIHPIDIFDPTQGAWVSYSGDLDTDHAYRIWGSPDLTYCGCHATVDQLIDLGSGQPTPRTHWIGTARNGRSNTWEWRLTDGDQEKTLFWAYVAGWIDDDMAYFDNMSGSEVGFKVWSFPVIPAWDGVKIQVLTETPLTLIIPRGVVR